MGFFTRYATFDNNAGDSTDSETEEIHFGVNYWPVSYTHLTLPTIYSV